MITPNQFEAELLTGTALPPLLYYITRTDYE